MGSKTKIEWCDATWNPVTGCTPVSDGCLNCWAKRLAGRFPQIHGYLSDCDFSEIEFHPDRLNIPFHWRKPKKIFVCSMGDLFHEQVAYAYIGEVFAVIRDNPQHTFMVLTKRPKRIPDIFDYLDYRTLCGGYLPNLWLGITAENQEMFDLRWSIASQIPATVLFVSGEPLLGGIDFSKCDRKPDWFIVGKETGPGKRPMNIDWARSLRDQCVAAGVPFFYKNGLLDGKLWQQYPEVLK